MFCSSGASRPRFIKTLAAGTLTPVFWSFFSKKRERDTIVSIWCMRKALIHSFISCSLGAEISMGDLTTLVRQKTTRKQNGRLVSYKHRILGQYNIFTYFDRNFMQHEVVEWSEVLRLQIIFFAHRVHLEIDHASVAKDDKA